MSYFLFHAWQHSKDGRRSLEDPIGIVSHQLRALGHQTIWDPENDARDAKDILFAHGDDQFNIILEGFTPEVIELIKRAHEDLGARFICLATEEPTPTGFNHGVTKDMVERQEMFPEAMKYFDGILHLVPGCTEWYARWAPAAYVELGFAPALVRPQRITQPKFDFGFYGSVTPRRMALLKKLRDFVSPSRYAVRIVGDFAKDEDRNLAMQDCKIVVQIRKFEEMGLVSSSRCVTSLCLGRPVIAEPHELSSPWDTIVKFTQSEQEFLLTCRMARANWRDFHGAQFHRFMTTLTPEFCVGAPLRSLQLNERRRAA